MSLICLPPFPYCGKTYKRMSSICFELMSILSEEIYVAKFTLVSRDGILGTLHGNRCISQSSWQERELRVSCTQFFKSAERKRRPREEERRARLFKEGNSLWERIVRFKSPLGKLRSFPREDLRLLRVTIAQKKKRNTIE